MFFGDGQSYGVSQFYSGPSLVAMATKFATKWAITHPRKPPYGRKNLADTQAELNYRSACDRSIVV